MPRDRQYDFYCYYAWSAEYLAGERLWTSTIATGDIRPGLPRVRFCNYTPFGVKMMAWLPRLPQSTAHVIWLYLQVVSIVAAMWLLAQGLDPPLELSATVVLISLALLSQSFEQLLFYSQVAAMVLLGVAGAWLAMRRRRPSIAGFCLAFITIFKIYPGILAVYLLFRRRWQELGWMTAFFSLGVVVTGVNDWIAYAWSVVIPNPRLSEVMKTPRMNARACLWSFAKNAASWLNHGGPPSSIAIIVFSTLVGAAALIVLLTVTLQTDGSDHNTEGLVFGLWIAAALIFSPLSWMHEFPLLIPCYLFAATLAYRMIQQGLPLHKFALFAGVVLVGFCLVPEFIHQLISVRPPYLVPIATLIGGALLIEARRDSAAPQVSRNPFRDRGHIEDGEQRT